MLSFGVNILVVLWHVLLCLVLFSFFKESECTKEEKIIIIVIVLSLVSLLDTGVVHTTM